MADEITNKLIQFALQNGVDKPKKNFKVDIELASNAEKLAKSKKSNEKKAGKMLLQIFSSDGNAVAEKTLDDINEKAKNFKLVSDLGAKENKEKADKNHALILSINKDLLENTRKTLDERAEQIHQDNFNVLSRRYAKRTIKNIITGKKSDMT